jgi:hypothetical protein
LGEAQIFHGPSVQEAELLLASGPADARSCDKSVEAQSPGDGGVHRDEFLGKSGPDEIADAIEGGVCRGQLESDAIVLQVGETDLGMSEGEELNLVFDVAGLGLLCAQEFAPGREVVEEGADFDLGAGRLASVADCFNFACVHENFSARQSMMFAGAEPEA